MHKPIFRAVVATCALSLAPNLIPAQAQIVGRPDITRAPVFKVARQPATRKPLPVITFTPPAFDLKLIPTADMSGWIQISSAATVGGAGFIDVDGDIRLVATGSDNTLYAAPFNPAAPALIPSTAWDNLTSAKFYSQPTCQTVEFTFSDRPMPYAVCIGLGNKGNAVAYTLSVGDGDLSYVKDLDMGGQGAAAPPAFLESFHIAFEVPESATTYWPQRISSPIMVWGGASNRKVFVDYIESGIIATKTGGMSVWGVAGGKTWSAFNAAFDAPPSCIPAYMTSQAATCVVASGDGKVTMYSLAAGTLSAQGDTKKISPALPVGLSGETTLIRTAAGRQVVIARGKDGQIYRTVFTNGVFSAWKGEGGFMTSKTAPACRTVNEAPVCVIQGADGKLYAKILSSAGAM